MAESMSIILPNLLDAVISIYFWTLLAYVLSSWLFALNIANPHHPVMRQVVQALAALHEPILRPIRSLLSRILPNMGGFDLSPLVALLLAQYLVRPMIESLFPGTR